MEALAHTLKKNNSEIQGNNTFEPYLDLDILLTSQRPDRVTLLTNAYFAPDAQRAFISGQTRKRRNLLFELRWAQLNIDVEHQTNPNADTLISISIVKTIYDDVLMRDKFFNSVLLLKTALGLLDLAYCDDLQFRSSSKIVSRQHKEQNCCLSADFTLASAEILCFISSEGIITE